MPLVRPPPIIPPPNAAAAAAHSNQPTRRRPWDPPADGPSLEPVSPVSPASPASPVSPRALHSPARLPAQIGGIFAAYGISLILVAITLLSLAKRRREHLKADFAPADLVLADTYSPPQPEPGSSSAPFHSFPSPARYPARGAGVPNFSYPSPVRTDFGPASPRTYPSPTSSVGAPGVDRAVDQRVVQADRDMAQQQLETMYRHVMEHEEAKQKGIVLETPDPRAASRDASRVSSPREKPQSKTQTFLSALRTPKKKSFKGVSISSPIMSPQSATFPVHDSREMGPMSPRSYAPTPSPLVLAGRSSRAASNTSRHHTPLTPELSPRSDESIDKRINAQVYPVEPTSATSQHFPIPLIALPTSPKFSMRRPSAVREGGHLPLRAYEPEMSSAESYTTKQTVFERKGHLSPMTGRTPFSAGSAPYSPYQPHTPCVPITPSLVTREDRKRMKKAMPKTPTTEMVKSTEEVW